MSIIHWHQDKSGLVEGMGSSMFLGWLVSLWMSLGWLVSSCLKVLTGTIKQSLESFFKVLTGSVTGSPHDILRTDCF